MQVIAKLLLRILASTAALWGLIAAAGAQEPAAKHEDLSVEEALQVCAAFRDTDDRLACFEALAASAGSPPGTVAAKRLENLAPAPNAAPPSVAATSAAPTEPLADAEGKAPIAAADSSKAAPRFTFLRDDPVREAKRKRKRYETTVYRAWRSPLGALRVAMLNGDIWVQAGRGVKYTPEPGEKVVMKPGLAGGWTLSMNDGKAGFRARLLQSDAK